MTYEKFVNTVIEQDSTKDRKSVRTFLWKFFITFFSYASILCTLCAIELPAAATPIVAIALLFMVIFMFDWFAEEADARIKAERISKLWILHLIVGIVGNILLITFLG